MTDLRARAIQIYDRFTHEHCDRRTLIREMALLAGSVAAAEGLIAGIAASPAAAEQVAADDERVAARKVVFGGLNGYFVTPAKAKGKRGGVLVVHENRGLNAHIRDVARQVALAGYAALALDFLSPAGGTPANEDEARTMIGALDLGAATANGMKALDWLRAQPGANGRTGVVGFCWGGAMANRLAVAAGDRLDAAVSYYGPAPDPAEAAKVQAAVLLQLAGNDARVNTTALPWGQALKAAGKSVVTQVYPDVDHAFNNDTSAERYNAAAAKLAWERTLALFKAKLG